MAAMSRFSGLAGAVVALCLGSGLALVAPAASVSIKAVDFTPAVPPGMAEEWYEVVIELEGETRELEARLDPLQVGLELAFRVRAEGREEFRFFRAAAEIVVPAMGDEVAVRFYLPPAIMERDELRREPFAWRVRLSQGGQVWPQTPASYSDALKSPPAAESFARRLQTEAERQDGLLVPIYLTPFYVAESGRLEDSPSYLRREAPGRLP